MKTKYTNLSNQRDKILKDVKTDRINKNIMNSNFRIKKIQKNSTKKRNMLQKLHIGIYHKIVNKTQKEKL